MRWFVAFCLSKTLRHQTFTRRSWQVNSKYLASSQLIAHTSLPKFCKLTRMSVMALIKLESILGIDSLETNNHQDSSLARNSCLSKTPFMNKYWMSLDLILTMLLNVLRPTDTTILLRRTICSTNEHYANKSPLQTSHMLPEVSIELLLHSMSEGKLLTIKINKHVDQQMKDSHVLMNGSERRA